MPSDLYTRVVLTVIAACLVYLCGKDALGPRSAQALSAQPVVLVSVQRAPGAMWDALNVSGR